MGRERRPLTRLPAGVDALAAALRQLRDRDYAAELRARGADPVHQMAAVFDGKKVYVRTAPAPRTKAKTPRARPSSSRAMMSS